MKNISEIKTQIEALEGYIGSLLTHLNTLDNSERIGKNGFAYSSIRENYFQESSENIKIEKRYDRLAQELRTRFPEYFSDLMISDLYNVRDLEELSRELPFILDTLKIVEAKESSNPFNYGLSGSFAGNNQRELFILMDCNSEAITVASKLTSLHKIYGELCRLLNVSESQFPLQIGHLEVGSIWTTIFGESKVIALMTKFLDETAHYFYRTKTNEGKRKETSKKVGEIKELLQLQIELKNNGFDTEEMRENIQKASHIVSQEYHNLLVDVSSIKVNGASYDFTNDNPRGLFANKRDRLLLENKENDEIK